MVLVGLFFFAMKTAGVHGRHGVVEKKQSVFGNKIWKEDGVALREYLL